jgi:hypothetical protein
MGYMVVNYLDDLGGAETLNKACDAYDTLGGLLAKCGLEEAVQKGVAPTTRMEVLGITVDTVKSLFKSFLKTRQLAPLSLIIPTRSSTFG